MATRTRRSCRSRRGANDLPKSPETPRRPSRYVRLGDQVLDYSSTMRRPNDTSREARQRQVDAYRAMTPEQRLQLADQMSVDVRSLARSGIRARQPDDASE